MLLCVALPLSAFAQNDPVDSGSFEFGLGTVFDFTYFVLGKFEDNISSRTSLGSDMFRFNFGYFVIDRLSVGGAFGFLAEKSEQDDDAALSFQLGPLVRYYFPIAERFLFNVEGILNYTWAKEVVGGTRDDALTQLEVGAGVATTFLINSNFGLGAGFDLTHFFNERRDGDAIDNTNFFAAEFGIFFRVFI
jgi:hypothetical protein